MTRGSLSLTLCLAVTGALLVPAAVHAETFCVNPPCPSSGTPQPNVNAALGAADATGERDRIEIGAGEVPLVNATVVLGNDVDIVGAGQGATTLVGDGGSAQPVLRIDEPTSTVSGLTLRLAPGAGRQGLDLSRGTASGVTVAADPGGHTGATGAYVGDGAALRSSRVLLPEASTNVAVVATPAAGQTSSLEDLELTGAIAYDSVLAEGTVNARRLNVHGSHQGIRAGGRATLNLTSSRVLVTGANARALQASTSFGTAPVLNARHVTLIGDGSAPSSGIDAHAGAGGTTSTVNVRDSIIRGFSESLHREATAGTASISVSYSDYDPLTISNSGAGGGAIAQGPGNVNVDPAFVDPGVGDFRLRSTSPLIDAGDPAPLGPFDSPTDLGRLLRVTDGNGDGVARADMGAHETLAIPGGAGPPSPVPPARDTTRPVLSSLSLSRTRFRAGPKSTPVGAQRRRAPRGTTIRFRLSEPAAVRIAVERRTTGRRVTRRGKRVCVRRTRSNRSRPACVRYAGIRTLVRRGRAGRNSVSFTGRIRGTALKAGRYRLRVWATDAAGNRSAQRALAFRIVR